MLLTLPPRHRGEPLTINTDRDRQIVVMGPNGSGKTRFARSISRQLGDQAYRLSALKAEFDRESEDDSPTSIDSLYRAQAKAGGLMRGDIKGQLERLIAMMLNEETLTLLQQKYLSDEKTVKKKRETTRLDRFISLWTGIFPDNRILIERGKLLIGNNSGSDTYSSTRLSAGESAVMYYIAGALYAPRGGVIIVEAPESFLHPSTMQKVWDRIERLRPDCTFIYVTHDISFASTRGEGVTVWVKSCDPGAETWDYEILPAADGLSEEMMMSIMGERKPVMFIEGDGVNSIDSKLYPLIFDRFTVKSLGGCDRVIEATRTFNSLKGLHNLQAVGIVDRDRRSPEEVAYLRERRIFVPSVAEIENIFMVEEVIKAVATHFHRDEAAAFSTVSARIVKLFEGDLRQQALQHTRHRVKKLVEHRIDGRFANINMLEEHINDLAQAINPRGMYEEICREFRRYVTRHDYASILRVYNRKSMLSESHVARACGLRSDDKRDYIRAILNILKDNRNEAGRIRRAVYNCFGLETDSPELK